MALTVTQRSNQAQLYNNTTVSTNNSMTLYDITGSGQITGTTAAWSAGDTNVTFTTTANDLTRAIVDGSQLASVPATNRQNDVVYDNGGTLQTPHRFRLTTDQSDGTGIGDGTALANGAAWSDIQ